MLILQTRKEIFDGIKSGERNEFYLPYKPYYQAKLVKHGLLEYIPRTKGGCCDPKPNGERVVVKLKNGFSVTAPVMLLEVICKEAKFAHNKKCYVLDIKGIVYDDES